MTHPADPDLVVATLSGLSPDYAQTPLLDLCDLAAERGLAQILAKDESRRALGSFKSLGGTFAGLRALARAAGIEVAELLARRPTGQPALLCASDGNHGLAVASAARHAGAPARVYLHVGVPDWRAGRIGHEGAEIVRIAGTYDDAVDAAARAALAGRGILVADTSDDPADPVVADVMAGYGVMAAEIRRQVEETSGAKPTHLFVQAGVGGLAAAMAEGLAGWLAPPGIVVAVDPESCACVAAALAAGHPVRLVGNLHTAAEMLSCGEASAPALSILRRLNVRAMTVSEARLEAAPEHLRAGGGPSTTPSGAAGFAGLLAALDHGSTERFGLGPESRVLVLVTEGAAEPTSGPPTVSPRMAAAGPRSGA